MKKLQFSKVYNNIIGTTIAGIAIVVLFCQISCQSDKKKVVADFEEPDSIPMMSTYGVSTLISDSGRISYKIDAEEWLVYDKRNPAHWAFEKGARLEKYDKDMNVEAVIECDTAYFYTEAKLWKLIGNVDIQNIKKEKFFTDLLYWSQEEKRIYSDAYIKIEQEDQITEGYGFSADQNLNTWLIKNTKGIYPIGE
ncbi:MAG: LPS export ABC transporter periplasmic protein LptC [Bacteroidaceae bacterium]|nr:LPS export ABC transporter periplasmic protein LptC [Bacteroidaceae bacterium]